MVKMLFIRLCSKLVEFLVPIQSSHLLVWIVLQEIVYANGLEMLD